MVSLFKLQVLAIFQEIGVNNTLYFLVFGESLFNGKTITNLTYKVVDPCTLATSANVTIFTRESARNDLPYRVVDHFTLSLSLPLPTSQYVTKRVQGSTTLYGRL